MKATTRITKDIDGEYRVRLFIDGQYQAGADYFTDDKEDAYGTAKHMRENAVFSDLSNPTAIEEMEEFMEENGSSQTYYDDDGNIVDGDY